MDQQVVIEVPDLNLIGDTLIRMQNNGYYIQKLIFRYAFNTTFIENKFIYLFNNF